MKKQLQVLVPIFNEEAVLRDSLQSLRMQSVEDVEFLLIDDCSSDASADICSEFLDDKRFRYVRNDKNLGLSKSLRTNVDLKNFSFIARHDADDLSAPSRFSEQLAKMKANENLGILGTAFYLFDYQREIFNLVEMPKLTRKSVVLKFMNGVNTGTAMYRSTALREIGGFKNVRGKVEGYATLKAILSIGYDISNLKSPLYVYRLLTVKKHRSGEGFISKRDVAMANSLFKSWNPLGLIWLFMSIVRPLVPEVIVSRITQRRKTRVNPDSVMELLNL